MSEIISNLIELFVIKNHNQKISFLMLKRSPDEWYPNLWQMVSGTINPDEKAYQTAIRELKEETGLEPLKLYVVPKVNSLYLFERDQIILIPVFVAVVDEKSEIKISDEHTEYKWCGFSETVKLLKWHGQKEVAKIIFNHWNNKKETIKFEEIILKIK